MDAVVVAWYGWLSSLSQAGVMTLRQWADTVRLPLITATVLGLIGSTSPCQLTTNLGALAYTSAEPGRRGPMALALAYVAGKVTVYSLAGAAVIVAGVARSTTPCSSRPTKATDGALLSCITTSPAFTRRFT
jgi:cytochrome c-type biogenesis protein